MRKPFSGESPEAASPYDALPDNMRGAIFNPFMGDLDEMIKRRVIRVGGVREVPVDARIVCAKATPAKT